MKRLIICCDGTWNTPEQEENNLPAPSNVVRLFNAVADQDAQGNEQSKYYHTGVGTEGSLLERTAGGVAGEGLDKNIKSAYFWLGSHYEPGDAVYAFGFSRGAYTARCLGGFIGRCGLLDLRDLSQSDPSEAWSRVDTAYKKGYGKENSQPEDWKKPDWAWRDAASAPIEFIGVWDTVGARGIPDDLAILNLFDNPDDWRFYDTRLGQHVRHARHAMAIDEVRASFTPTLWTDEQDRPIYDDGSGRVKQLWFAGVHSDVGGGYSSNGLSDIALRWMIDEAAAAGLGFRQGFVDQIRPDPRGVLHDSVKGLFKALRTRPRNVPAFDDAAKLHPAARDRHGNPPITQAPYHPTRKLSVGESASLPVYARMHWNALGIYLEAGAHYTFTADGEWLDRKIACGPKGTKDGKFQPAEIAHLVGSLFGKLEGAFQKITGNKNADFAMTRRLEKLPWFSLVGVIANDGLAETTTPGADGSPTPHQYLPIGAGPLDVTVERPGYLFAFANDAWHFYDNNRGSVTLTVKRTA
jgi:T6SS, Phospholipase effector Tle1-like, catalytic domain